MKQLDKLEFDGGGQCMQMLINNAFFLLVIVIGIFSQLASYKTGDSKNNSVSLFLLTLSFLLLVFSLKYSHGSEFLPLLSYVVFSFELGNVGCKVVIYLRGRLKKNK